MNPVLGSLALIEPGNGILKKKQNKTYKYKLGTNVNFYLEREENCNKLYIFLKN